MGCKCLSANSNVTDGGDLTKISVSSISDPVKRFECGFPFHRMDVTLMFDRINSFDKEYIMIYDLKTILKGTIWAGKFEDGEDV
jgi:hypothetical protein